MHTVWQFFFSCHITFVSDYILNSLCRVSSVKSDGLCDYWEFPQHWAPPVPVNSTHPAIFFDSYYHLPIILNQMWLLFRNAIVRISSGLTHVKLVLRTPLCGIWLSDQKVNVKLIKAERWHLNTVMHKNVNLRLSVCIKYSIIPKKKSVNKAGVFTFGIMLPQFGFGC